MRAVVHKSNTSCFNPQNFFKGAVTTCIYDVFYWDSWLLLCGYDWKCLCLQLCFVKFVFFFNCILLILDVGQAETFCYIQTWTKDLGLSLMIVLLKNITLIVDLQRFWFMVLYICFIQLSISSDIILWKLLILPLLILSSC